MRPPCANHTAARIADKRQLRGGCATLPLRSAELAPQRPAPARAIAPFDAGGIVLRGVRLNSEDNCGSAAPAFTKASEASDKLGGDSRAFGLGARTAGRFVMGHVPDIRDIASAARTRILLICPDCGEENVEFADRLRGRGFYVCAGEGCDFRFDLAAGPRRSLTRGFAEAWRRFYAALSPAG